MCNPLSTKRQLETRDDRSMDTAGGTEDLDPRIHVELEQLNSATDEINNLEKHLDNKVLVPEENWLWGDSKNGIRITQQQHPYIVALRPQVKLACVEKCGQASRPNTSKKKANGEFRLLLSQRSGELEKLIRRFGSSIDRARPFYNAKSAANLLHKKCLDAAVQFQRANDIHQAAKNTVTAAEQRYSKDVHFDGAWQEVLNHATIKVMEAEKLKSDSEKRHQTLAEQFYQAEKKVYELEKLLHNDILKSKSYFDMKDDLNATLNEVKTNIVQFQTSITKAKRAYSIALSNLEMISEEIHRKRTPGVGAEDSELSLNE